MPIDLIIKLLVVCHVSYFFLQRDKILERQLKTSPILLPQS